jgi:hypothetical protein
MFRLILSVVIVMLIGSATFAAEPATAAASTQPAATSQPANDYERVAEQTVKILDDAASALVPVKDEATAKAALPKLAAAKKEADEMRESVAKLGAPSEAVQAAMMSKYAKRIEASYLKLASEQQRVRTDPALEAIVGKPLDELGLVKVAKVEKVEDK